ncbi:uncharacterized protein LOC112451401 isoform X1 [Kryptolebias marmoratus]|uniref:uncharacterized protein LOC112451401 isoform X1 n=1 Tax=Kryptolebias marmoratus TaxID=37003 RepID=UPI0018ACDAF7|nr:uncharacterized protein LOC112451401 isoform X1 [Kryptolebias marmoratus]
MYSYGGSGKTVCVGVVQGSCKYANRLEELEGASAGSTPQAQGPIIRPRSSTMSRTSGMPNVAGRHPVDGDFHSSEELTNCLYQNFPKLRTAGGYELLKNSGNTRSRQLYVIQCPNEGYTVQYLKEPSTMIHHSTIYICPLQCNINMEQVTISAIATVSLTWH